MCRTEDLNNADRLNECPTVKTKHHPNTQSLSDITVHRNTTAVINITTLITVNSSCYLLSIKKAQNTPTFKWLEATRCWLAIHNNNNNNTHLTTLCLGLPRWAGTKKVKPIWILLKQETRDSEWQWHQLGHMQTCTSPQTDNHTSTPSLSFLQAGCPSCCPTNSVKAIHK